MYMSPYKLTNEKKISWILIRSVHTKNHPGSIWYSAMYEALTNWFKSFVVSRNAIRCVFNTSLQSANTIWLFTQPIDHWEVISNWVGQIYSLLTFACSIHVVCFNFTSAQILKTWLKNLKPDFKKEMMG